MSAPQLLETALIKLLIGVSNTSLRRGARFCDGMVTLVAHRKPAHLGTDAIYSKHVLIHAHLRRFVLLTFLTH